MLCYLTDEDLHDFLVNTKESGLTRERRSTKTGLIFIKENTAEDWQFQCDFEQNAVWRNRRQMRAIFEGAGFRVLYDKD